MAFSEHELKRIERLVGGFCERRSPPEYRDEVRLEYRVRGHDVVVLEVRSAWDDPTEVTESPVAKFKFVRTEGEWRLLWRRRDLKWHGYEPLPASANLEELVAEVDRDPHGCFFG